MTQVCFLAVICLLVPFSVRGQGCVWEVEPGQGLNIQSYDNGANLTQHLTEVLHPETCQQACCESEQCNRVFVGTPADTFFSECFLLNCLKNGEDVCIMESNSMFNVYRKSMYLSRDSANDSVSNATEYCLASQVVGPCRASFSRYYYDPTNQTCLPFIYGGCDGNGNNFESIDDCEATCSGVTGSVETNDQHTPNVRRRMAAPISNKAENLEAPLPTMTSSDFAELCQASPVKGPCRAALRHFFYNHTAGACQSFMYGGCGGNKNNYASSHLCHSTCTVTVLPQPNKPSTEEEYREACAVPADSGPCRAAFPKFYFDPVSESCQTFVYGGCKGNGNNYDSHSECMSRCAGQEGHVDEHGHHHSHWTPGFFLVATLAVMSALLLVTMVLLFTRRAKLLRHLSHDDKEELLPEEEDTKGKPSA